MLPQRLDVTFALKTISLVRELSSADKRVAVAILDHFNRKTAQCDPSIQRIAWLLTLDERTVKSSIKKLHRLGLIEKIRHGGHMLRNSYRPNWHRFRQLETEWNKRFKAAEGRYRGANPSPTTWQKTHLASGETNTQTNSINQFKGTCYGGCADDRPSLPNKSTGSEEQPIKGSKKGKQDKQDLLRTGLNFGMSYGEAARVAAERRWANALNRRFAAAPEIHAAVLDAIDDRIQSAATECEVAQRGAGLTHILNELRRRNVLLASKTERFQQSQAD